MLSPDRARPIANALLIAGAATAAYLVLSRPDLRRLAWNLSRRYLAEVPGYLRRGIADAWMQSGQTS